MRTGDRRFESTPERPVPVPSRVEPHFQALDYDRRPRNDSISRAPGKFQKPQEPPVAESLLIVLSL